MPAPPAKPMPEAGGRAPAFTLPAQDGAKCSLSSLKGQRVVLYFYPKDDTPGCTIEAKEFQSMLPEFAKRNAVVLGVSPDDTESHCKFAAKYDLNFGLLADLKHEIAGKYGVWVEKNMYGKKYMGVQRATFLIGADGKIIQAWPKVKPEGHARAVLEALDEDAKN